MIIVGWYIIHDMILFFRQSVLSEELGSFFLGIFIKHIWLSKYVKDLSLNINCMIMIILKNPDNDYYVSRCTRSFQLYIIMTRLDCVLYIITLVNKSPISTLCIISKFIIQWLHGGKRGFAYSWYEIIISRQLIERESDDNTCAGDLAVSDDISLCYPCCYRE